ncbi:uncharacterized protein B0H18DRAFT_970680 [Fomitopsis serialis]|uniref:uncharacterized protein n=1 Tax=Fomitopsis serialis TaxID=139415 RepID=UPI002008D3AB|nr:uncharacterized protein B0H18DRAFT_970680 [Neoantrodia serialis]KAH9937449.1 hypothetical protein B0H18DRAFT_970680 [Neoantrodia serialis]
MLFFLSLTLHLSAVWCGLNSGRGTVAVLALSSDYSSMGTPKFCRETIAVLRSCRTYYPHAEYTASLCPPAILSRMAFA